MRHSHMTIAFAFFCGFRAPAQMPTPVDSASRTPLPLELATAKQDSAKPSKSEEEGPPHLAKPIPIGTRDTISSRIDSLRLIPFNLGIAPGMASNGKHPEQVLNHVSIDLVAGEAGAIKGIQASGAMNELHGPMSGLQASAGLNRVEGTVTGVQFSTVNLVKGDVTGFQGSYVLNRVDGNVGGYQASSFANLVDGDVKGVQASSLYGSVRTMRGLQFNSVCVADTLYGVQWGLVNVAGRAKGLQFGLVNVSRGGNAAQIGLVNVHPDTRIYAESWVDETRTAHVAMNYGGPNFYSLVELVGSQRHPHTTGLGLGFGARVASPKNILAIDQSALFLGTPGQMDDKACDDNDDLGGCDANVQFRTRLVAGRHLWKRFAVFGGVSYNVLISPDETSGRKLLEPEGEYHYDPSSEVRLWPGVFVGIRI